MYKLYNDDCLNILKDIEDTSISAVIADPPYNETRSRWDNIIDFSKLWTQLKRIVKDNAPIVLFGNEPFSSHLRLSNMEMYRYDWKWVKNRPTGFANANFRPMRKYEDIIVFSKAFASAGGKNNSMIYNPQGLIEVNKTKKNVAGRMGIIGNDSDNLGKENVFNSDSEYVQKYTNYPSNILEFECETKQVHPTQKPLNLMKYLVKTYSNEGDTILDFCMGSGSTGVASIELNRNFIGIEKEEKYFCIAEERIKSATENMDISMFF